MTTVEQLVIRVKDKLVEMTDQQVDNFIAKQGRRGETECWIWEAGKCSDGYGAFTIGKDSVTAHRVSYQLHFGPIPMGICVLHNCPNGDNRACTNPNHLWLGTHLDNMRDMERKGRGNHPSGDRNGKRTKPECVKVGEACNLTKLTEKQVREIRALSDQGRTRVEVSRMFGVTPECISSIALRVSWKHLT